ncbi:ATP-grasp domain-containing protein [Paenibacillus tundrae]
MFPKGIQNLQNRLILSKALEMGIECKPLLAGCEDFLELSSQGRKIIINKTRSHHLPLIAGLLAKNKQVCNMLLEQQGMPVPSFVVLNGMGDEAVRFLEVNQSIVVKPLDASSSAGVTLAVQTVHEMETAIERALAHSTSIMLQRFVRGIDYRVLVINGAIAAVNKYRPVFVEGNGISTIKELIQRLNQERLQLTHIGEYEAFPKLEEDSAQLQQALRAQGVTLMEVPSLGRQIELYLLQNSAAGNISEFYMDCTEDMHEANALMAIQAANALQIDVAGIDIRCSDIRVPITKENGGILEVNALPDMTHHVFPHGGTTRDVVRMYLEYLVQHEPVLKP